MPANARIYYPIHAIGFAPLGASAATGYRAAKGVQSVGLNTNFNTEQVYQLGQVEIYENIENSPDVEITVEKVIDGYSLIQHLATPQAVSATLAGRFNDNRCMALLAYYPIISDGASGIPLTYVQLSGAYVSAINWNIPVEGNITESVTLVCRDKRFFNSPSAIPWASGAFRTTSFTGNESPVLASGGVQRRENVVMGSGWSRWPTDIPGIDVNGFNASGVNGFDSHIQNVTVSVSLERTDLFELGRKGAYFRYANFPVEVTTTIEVTASELGDNVQALEDVDNLSEEVIKIYLTNGVIIDLGTKNKLTSVSETGGDVGGDNRTVSYSYSNFNSYRCTSASVDPAGL